ncbi:MAG: hypothetical protein IT376_21120 [Polyangiaceae bacterium]|nr:hypothetical protein [Polyangiaceae bacterium]
MMSVRGITLSKSAYGVALGLLAALSVHCGGGGGSPGGQSTDQMVQDLLRGADTGGGGQPPPGGQQNTLGPAPSSGGQPTAGSGSSGGGGSSEFYSFEENVQRIKEKVPTWDNGSGVTVNFLNETSGKRLSIVFVDQTAPIYKDQIGLWVVQGKATGNNETLGHMVIGLQNLAPGRYSGSPSNKSVVMSIALTSGNYDGNSPETTWTINQGGWIELTLQEGRSAGDLEGTFRAKLYSNDTKKFYTVENGYLYINR